MNIEENSQGEYPYVLPPGFNRDRDNTSVIDRQLNEQSLQLCVEELQNKDARAVFKDVKINLINYGRIKMFIHAHDNGTSGAASTEKMMNLQDFIRLSTDLTENYYEIEVPLESYSFWLDRSQCNMACRK